MVNETYFKLMEHIADTEPVDMSLLSVKEWPHFYGGETNDRKFDVEVKLYQRNPHNKMDSIRHAGIRISGKEIVKYETKNIPDEKLEEVLCRGLISFRLAYPEGVNPDKWQDLP